MSALISLCLCLTFTQTLISLQPKSGRPWWQKWLSDRLRRFSRPSCNIKYQLTIPKSRPPKPAPRLNLQDLPLELVLQILHEATDSQSTYRSLLLVSRATKDIVRLEFLRDLPIILSQEDQYESFLNLVQSDPEIGSCIRYIWLVPLDYESISLPELILTHCPNIVSLACQPQTLLSFLSSSPDAQLPFCTELTLQDWLLSSWSTHRANFVAFCDQIAHLHLIGPFVDGWTIPNFPNLLTVSISHGRMPINVGRFDQVFSGAPTLEHIDLITELENRQLRFLSYGVDTWNERAVETRPKLTLYQLQQDWTDLALWSEGLTDKALLSSLHQRVSHTSATPFQKLLGWLQSGKA